MQPTTELGEGLGARLPAWRGRPFAVVMALVALMLVLAWAVPRNVHSLDDCIASDTESPARPGWTPDAKADWQWWPPKSTCVYRYSDGQVRTRS
jgi:hypothetical protein